MKTVNIDITEDDCELLMREIVYNQGTIEWIFPEVETGEEIKVRFIPYEEQEAEG